MSVVNNLTFFSYSEKRLCALAAAGTTKYLGNHKKKKKKEYYLKLEGYLKNRKIKILDLFHNPQHKTPKHLQFNDNCWPVEPSIPLFTIKHLGNAYRDKHIQTERG